MQAGQVHRNQSGQWEGCCHRAGGTGHAAPAFGVCWRDGAADGAPLERAAGAERRSAGSGGKLVFAPGRLKVLKGAEAGALKAECSKGKSATNTKLQAALAAELRAEKACRQAGMQQVLVVLGRERLRSDHGLKAGALSTTDGCGKAGAGPSLT